MHRVMLLNPKGGSGKTTLATSLASYFAVNGWPTILFDHDAQGSSTRWLRARPAHRPAIEGVAAFEAPAGTTRSWQMRVPPGIERVVIDTPAGLRDPELADLVRRTDCVIVPVLPSYIDIDAVAGFLGRLRRTPAVRDGDVRVAVVGNRVRPGTVASSDLERFLDGLGYPFLTTLRESQHYVRAAESGLGVHELRGTGVRRDQRQWEALIGWVDGRRQGELDFDAAARLVAAR